MKVLTVSRFFPAYHPRKGEPTYFVEKILRGLYELRDTVKPMMDMDVWANCVPKRHTIRESYRWREGEWVSLRVWSDKPYKSKQIEFAQIQLKQVIPVTIFNVRGEMSLKISGEDKPSELIETVAKNDGLTLEDFKAWFKSDITLGQILCWGDVNY